MNSPKAGTPWQRGKVPGRTWSKEEWGAKMQPWVENQLVGEKKEEKETKKRKRKNKGRKRAIWFANKMQQLWEANNPGVPWPGFGQSEHPDASSSTEASCWQVI
jgi:hypothetical protein